MKEELNLQEQDDAINYLMGLGDHIVWPHNWNQTIWENSTSNVWTVVHCIEKLSASL